MTLTLTDKELEILGLWLRAWDDDCEPHSTYARMSYQDVIDLAKKLNLPQPENIIQFCENPIKALENKC